MGHLVGYAAVGIIDKLISLAIVGLILLFAGFVFVSILVVLITLGIKRKITLKWLRTASDQLKQTISGLSAAILSEAFKDLEFGMMQGESRRILADLQQTVLSLHRQAERLQQKVQEQQAPFLSLVKPLYRAYKLKRETRYFANQVEPVLRDLQRHEQQEKQLRQHNREAKAKLQESLEMLQKKNVSKK